jgi:hypothetical protein
MCGNIVLLSRLCFGLLKMENSMIAPLILSQATVLNRAGYKAWRKIIYDPKYASPSGNHHRVCVFEANGKKYVYAQLALHFF